MRKPNRLPTLTAKEHADSLLKDGLQGPNSEWLRASLVYAETADLLHLALDAALLANVLRQRAQDKLRAAEEIEERALERAVKGSTK